jgi:hypothetical protein
MGGKLGTALVGIGSFAAGMAGNVGGYHDRPLANALFGVAGLCGLAFLVLLWRGRGKGGPGGGAGGPVQPVPGGPSGIVITNKGTMYLQLVVNAPIGVPTQEVDEEAADELLKARLVEVRAGKVFPTRRGRRFVKHLEGSISPSGEVQAVVVRVRVRPVPVERPFRVGVAERVPVHLLVEYEGPPNRLSAQVVEVVSASGKPLDLPIPWSVKWADSNDETISFGAGQRRLLELAQADLMGGPSGDWFRDAVRGEIGTYWFQRPSAAPLGISLGSGIQRTSDLYERRLRVMVKVTAIDPPAYQGLRLLLGFRQDDAFVYPVGEVEGDSP